MLFRKLGVNLTKFRKPKRKEKKKSIQITWKNRSGYLHEYLTGE